MQKLSEALDTTVKLNNPDFYREQVPGYIYSNLKNGFGQRHYQQEAFGRFIFFWENYPDKPKDIPTQLLYHMATGSGKTLIMAGLIIYLYEQGYRNFLFFVNSTNIIDKTRDNFFNTNSSKYLFSDVLSIDGNQVRIKEVDNFQAANQHDINIVFSTIQGLHSRLNVPKENGLTYDDFEESKIVLISDEAHHINAETKKSNELAAEEKEEIVSWEGTVNRIFNANKENVLLEFTATADLSIPQIAGKYSNKLIYDYPLKQFRIDGYSKEVKVLQADLSPFERALQGVLLSQYRRKVFEKYKKIIKPVILFKSKTIKDSQLFFDEFSTGIKTLNASALDKIKKNSTDNSIASVFQYLEENAISLENLILELQGDFSEGKLISVNSKDESEQKQLAVNSLEDEANEYRAIFAVDKLNEGWDVLNLFDIVRLYDTNDGKKGKPGKTTMAEAQLIGRGARYCPFKITEEQSFYKRKFDDDTANELRICEELYYHSAYNPKYIQELNSALEEIGIKGTSVVVPLKKSKGTNKQKKHSKSHLHPKPSIIAQVHKINLKTGYNRSDNVFQVPKASLVEIGSKAYRLVDFGEHIIRKAIHKLEFYQFSNLQKLFPELGSISQFIGSEDYLGKIRLEVSGLPEQITNLSARDKLDASLSVLQDISKALSVDII